MTENNGKTGRTQLLVLFGIAFASLGIAWCTYFIVKDGSMMSTTNNGTFVDPPRHVDSLALGDATFNTREKWWLWFVADDCDRVCTKTMHDLKSAHVLLNRDSTRVARALLTNAAKPGQLTGSEREKVELLEKPGDLKPGVYIVDPIGNMVLQYPVDTPPKPVLEDLKKLLKLSQIG